VPRRRAFAEAMHGLGSLHVAFAFRAALTGEAGSRSTGDPSLTSVQ